MSQLDYISTPQAPAPGGHYSQAIGCGGQVFVSGQLPIGGETGPEAPFERQAQIALDNLLTVLAAAGCGPGEILKVTVYLVGIENWPRFNALYAERLGDARPARSIVPVPSLHHGYLVEIDAVATRAGTPDIDNVAPTS